MDFKGFEERKREHLRQALEPNNQATGWSGLDRIRLRHEALPDLDFDQVQLRSQDSFLGTIKTPLVVTGMTAGHPGALQVNETLASACERRGWIFGLGSQRRDIEAARDLDANTQWKENWAQFRAQHPDLCILANIGISQLVRGGTEAAMRLVDTMRPSALAIHLNALQEVIQPEGTPHFLGGSKIIANLVKALPVPVVVKETGCGITQETGKRLVELGVRAIDVSGLGGTHWGRIEGARAQGHSVQSVASQTFAHWGEPTAESVREVSKAVSGTSVEVWASGGLRSGLDAAKAIALGAHRAGFAMPALQAAQRGPEALDQWMAQIEFELRVALFVTGAGSCEKLRKKDNAWTTIIPFSG